MKTENIDQVMHDYFEKEVETQPEIPCPSIEQRSPLEREPYRDIGLKFAFALSLMVLFFSLPTPVLQYSPLVDDVNSYMERNNVVRDFQAHLDRIRSCLLIEAHRETEGK